MRNAIVVLWMLLCSITSVAAQVSVGIGFPGVSIGINLPVYPQLVAVPGYPVYYAPQVNSNYFFYDGMYWVYQQDNWYASSWYNGPWALVRPDVVPLFVLRVPVRYYRQPPVYFRGWRSDAPPRWGEHWGNTWEQHHSGWDRWDRGAVPAPAPLPVYQRQYSGSHYPQFEQQQALQSRNYRYQPHEPVVQQHYQAQQRPSAPAPSPQARQPVPQERAMPQQDSRGTPRAAPPHQAAPAAVPQGPQPQQGAMQRQPPSSRTQGQDRAPQVNAPVQESAAQRPTPQPQQAAVQRQPQAAKTQGQDKAPQGRAPMQEPAAQHLPQQPQQAAMQRQQAPRARGEDKGGDKGEQQGGEHNK